MENSQKFLVSEKDVLTKTEWTELDGNYRIDFLKLPCSYVLLKEDATVSDCVFCYGRQTISQE
jgi:hypothetical protein